MFRLSIILFGFLVLLAGTNGGANITGNGGPVDPNRFFLPRTDFILNCTSDATQSPTWGVDGDVTKIANRSAMISDGNYFSKATFNFSPTDGGNYTCGAWNGTQQNVEAFYFVNVYAPESVEPIDVTTNGTQKEVVLRCKQRFNKPLPLLWTRSVFNATSGQYESVDLNNASYSVDASKEYALVIRNDKWGTGHAKTGEYFCEFNTTGSKIPEGAEKIFKSVSYRSKPDVAYVGRKLANTDEPFILTCVFAGHSSDNVTWKFNNLILTEGKNFNDENCSTLAFPSSGCWVNASDRYSYELNGEELSPNASGVVNKTSILTILNALDVDQGEYNCIVWNEYGFNNASVRVKVVDKWAALWPFVAMVVEVMILCGILFYCEKRREKKAAARAEEPEMETMQTVPVEVPASTNSTPQENPWSWNKLNGNKGVRNRK